MKKSNSREDNTVTPPQHTKEEHRLRHKRTMVVAAFITLIVIIILLMTRCGNTSQPEPTQPGYNVPTSHIPYEIDPDAQEGEREKEDPTESLNQQVAEGSIRIEMNSAPVFDTATAEGNLLIYNHDTNRLGQVVEIVVTDTQESIYRSGIIPVGSRIDYAVLDVPLADGTYNCIAYFTAVTEDGTPAGTAAANIVVTIQN